MWCRFFALADLIPPQSVPPGVWSSFRGIPRRPTRPCSGQQREMWKNWLWEIQRVVKAHCHLFLMSSLIIKCALSSDIALGKRGRRWCRRKAWWWESNWNHACGFINVHESKASGNSFLSPVSGQCLCSLQGVRVALFSFTFTYCCCCWDPSTPQLRVTTNLKILDQLTQRAPSHRRGFTSLFTLIYF